MDTVELTTETCQQASGELGKFVDTFHNTKDLDLLRVLLGREKINWIGYSAGTWLGAHYAQRFPDRVGRFVLDSSVDFTSTWAASFDRQPMGYERRWRQDFLPWAATHDDEYGLGATGEEVRQTFKDVRYELARNPVEVDGMKIGPGDLDSRFIGLLKSKQAFRGLADFLVQLRTLTGNDAPEQAEAQARAAIADAPAEPGPDDAMLAVLTAVRCNDSATPGDRQSVIRRSQEFLDQGYLLAGGYWMFLQKCIFWEGEPRPLPTLDGKGVPPVVMVQSENDPATPIEGAQKAHAGFENSRLLTVTGEGDHGIYGYGNAAVDEIVDAYLVDGVVPEDRSVPGTPRYTEAVFRAGAAHSDDVAERHVAGRMERQQILNRVHPPRFSAILDEGALHRQIGGQEVLCEQLEHLCHMAVRHNIDIKVLPFESGEHLASNGSFTILDFPDPLDVPVAFTETVTASLFVEDPEELASYDDVWANIQAASMTAARSVEFIQQAIRSSPHA